jgi:enoyl-CoA hydratase/carnithine racemase
VNGNTLIRVERRNGVDIICLTSPTNRNALSIRMLDELTAALASSAQDPASRGALVTHDGPVFCAGVDVVERRTTAAGPRDHSNLFADLLVEMWNYPKPLGCRIAGAVRGGGMGLVACADVSIATAASSFAFAEVKLGVVPAVVGALAIAKLGAAGLTPWLLSGDTFDATAAARIGLVSHLAAEDATVESDAFAASLRSAAPTAVIATKALIRRHMHVDIAAMMNGMRQLSAQSFDSPEGREGMLAFAEKRLPAWAVPE